MPTPPNTTRAGRRPVWTPPWGYAEGWLIVAGLLVVSYALQWIGGSIHPRALAWPVNAVIAIGFSVFLILLQVMASRLTVIAWLGRIPASICAIALITLLVLVMGLVLQDDEAAAPWIQRLGLSTMTTSLPFFVAVFFFLTTLGMATLKQVWPLRGRKIGFLLNHLGLYLAVLAGVMGSADVRRLMMELRYDEIEWRATDRMGHVFDMPLAMKLLAFEKEEFPPKAAIVESETHRMAPGMTAELFEIQTGTIAPLAEWEVEILHFLPLSMPVEERFEPVLDMGAGPAARVRATQRDKEIIREGWITCGSFAFPHQLLELDERYSLAMTVPRASAYRSRVLLYTPEHDAKEVVIEVNKPHSVGGWKLYQYSYDDRFGRWSPTSIIEVIRDPWLPVVYTGIFMMLAGAVYLLFKGRTKERNHASV